MNLEISIPKKLVPLFQGDARYRVAYGGRGSGKTWAFAQMAIARALSEKLLILCTREFQNSIKDSVHSLLVQTIERMGLSSLFVVTDAEIMCKTTNSKFIFKGLRRNHQEIKGIEGINICWVEEGQATTEESFKVLSPTIRANNSEIWVTFNPFNELDFVYQHFVLNPPSDCKSVEINYMDNKWFPAVLEKERQDELARSQSMHDHIWLGKCLSVNQRLMLPISRIRAAVEQTAVVKAQTFVLSVDPSQGAGDKTAFCWRWGDVIDRIETYDGMDEMQCAGMIVMEAQSPNCAQIVIDSTGFGTTIMRRVQEQGVRNIVGVNFGSADVIDASYANKRAEIYGKLRDALHGDQPPKIPNEPLLIKELSYVPWKLTSAGKTILEPKEDIKSYLGHSPDMADALALSFAPYVKTQAYVTTKKSRHRGNLPY